MRPHQINAPVSRSETKLEEAQSSVDVPGLSLYLNWVTKELEEELITHLEKGGVVYSTEDDSTLNRRVMHYGYLFDFKTRNINRTFSQRKEFPQFLVQLFPRLCEIGLGEPDQITVNEYLPGQGIGKHVDTHLAFGESITVLSLGSHTTMELSSPHETKYLFLPSRSLFILQGESRYFWAHAVQGRMEDKIGGEIVKREKRISIVFRNIRGGDCRCDWPQTCQCQSIPLGTADFGLYLKALKNQEQFMKITYPHHSVVPNLPQNTTVLTIANSPNQLSGDSGRKIEGFNINVFLSNPLNTNINNADAMYCDGVFLAFKTGMFDLVVCYSSLHLLPEIVLQRMIQEMVRVMNYDATLLVYVANESLTLKSCLENESRLQSINSNCQNFILSRKIAM